MWILIIVIFFVAGLEVLNPETMYGFLGLFVFSAGFYALCKKLLAHRKKPQHSEAQTYKERWLILLSCTLGSPYMAFIDVLYALDDANNWVGKKTSFTQSVVNTNVNGSLIMTMGGETSMPERTSVISDRTVTLGASMREGLRKGRGKKV